jgi:hypothetical protein
LVFPVLETAQKDVKLLEELGFRAMSVCPENTRLTMKISGLGFVDNHYFSCRTQVYLQLSRKDM